MGLVLADSAYASGEALDAFAAAGYGTAIKPIDRKPRIAGGFTRDDFTIDTDAQTVTCPAGHTKAIKSGAARFGALCGGCPLRARCTTAAAGRSVTVDEHHQRRQANKTRFAQTATQAAYRRHRPMAERSIAWLTRNKARRVPYRGVAANHLWLTTRAAAVNLTRLTNLGITHTGGHSPCEPPRQRRAPRPAPPTAPHKPQPRRPTPPTQPGTGCTPVAQHSPRGRPRPLLELAVGTSAATLVCIRGPWHG